MCNTSNSACLCLDNKPFTASTPNLKVKRKELSVKDGGKNKSPELKIVSKEVSGGKVKSLIEFYNDENPSSSGLETYFETNIGEISSILIDNIIEEIASKRVEKSENDNKELKCISLSQYEKLKAQEEQMDNLKKENVEIFEVLEEALSENLKMKVQLNKQTRLETSIIEENKSLKIDITKEKAKGKEINGILLKKNEELKRRTNELKEKLNDREQEIQVIRRWRNKEAEMDKSQIENLEGVLEIAKHSLNALTRQYEEDAIEIAREKLELDKEKKELRIEKSKINEQMKKVLGDKDELFVEQNKLELREDLLEKEKETFEILKCDFDMNCQSQQILLMKTKADIQEEREIIEKKKKLLDIELQKLESDRDKFNYYYRPIIFCGLILGSLILLHNNFRK